MINTSNNQQYTYPALQDLVQRLRTSDRHHRTDTYRAVIIFLCAPFSRCLKRVVILLISMTPDAGGTDSAGTLHPLRRERRCGSQLVSHGSMGARRGLRGACTWHIHAGVSSANLVCVGSSGIGNANRCVSSADFIRLGRSVVGLTNLEIAGRSASGEREDSGGQYALRGGAGGSTRVCLLALRNRRWID